jgi:hypothetical protein
MNTHGHENVAQEAGLPLLRKTFNVRMGNPRFNAFYLGNLRTDLSQLVDPVAFTTGNEKQLVDEVFSFSRTIYHIPEPPYLIRLDPRAGTGAYVVFGGSPWGKEPESTVRINILG